MTLKNLSVKKFAELYDIRQSDFYATDVDRNVALLSCLTDTTEDVYLDMMMDDFKKEVRKLNFVNLDTIPAKASRYIVANGNVYAPVYDFRKFTAGQFVDVCSFAKDPARIIENLPKILASICVPVKRVFGLRKLQAYGARPHNEVAADMNEASIFDAYSIAVFFWKFWILLLRNTGDYLVSEMVTEKMKTGTMLTPEEMTGLLTILEMYGDGIAARKGLEKSTA